MKRRVTYDLFNCFNALKGIITLCLLITMLTKPVVCAIFDLAKIECEILESSEEKELEEKENTIESEKEDQKHYYSYSDFEFHSIYKNSFFTFHKDLNNTHFENPFPPPDRG